MAARRVTAKPAVPLVVDVDGTLLSGDLLIEGLARLASTAPLMLLAVPFWLMRGRAATKRQLAEAAPLSSEMLVLNPAVEEEVAEARIAGRAVWLASGADGTAVAPLAERVGAAGVLASDGRTNLVGEAKAAALMRQFGEGGFDYVGNGRQDLPVWRRCRQAIGVGLTRGFERKVRVLHPEARFLPGVGVAGDYIRALRPRQWIKNTLLFLPLLAMHETQLGPYLLVAGLFLAFSAVASATYLANDLLDLPYDREHRTKRLRPMAAGKLRLSRVVTAGVALVAAGLAAAFWLSPAGGLSVLAYLIAAVAYSLWLKRRLLLDAVALALLYVLRVFAGAVAVAVPLSPWLLAFSLFIFVALAIVKRQVELAMLHQSGGTSVAGRTYRTADLPTLAALAGAAAFAAAVVLTLYIQSPTVHTAYGRPEALWLICPLLIYWLGRMILLASRGNMDDDPVLFAVRDRASWLTGVGILAVCVAAL